nr:hypothetical protein [Nocardia barduliensis]
MAHDVQHPDRAIDDPGGAGFRDQHRDHPPRRRSLEIACAPTISMRWPFSAFGDTVEQVPAGPGYHLVAQPVMVGVFSRESRSFRPVGAAHVGMDGGDPVQHTEVVELLDQNIHHRLAVLAATQAQKVVVVSTQVRPRSHREIDPTAPAPQ